MAISLSGDGLVFPATFSNSSNANTMDDYEEGETTAPTISCSGNSNQVTRTGNSMFYVKMGKGFIGQWESNITNLNSGTGTLLINLPFSSQDYGAHALRVYNVDYDNAHQFGIVNEPNASTLQTQQWRDATSSVGLLSTGYYYSGWSMICPYSSPFLG